MNELGTKKIITSRLILRKIEEKDSKEIYEGFINQDEFCYYANKPKRTLEEQIKSLVGIKDKYLNPYYFNWVIVLECNNKIIGSINAHFVEEENKVIINYGLDNRYFNNGYMSEALSSVLKYLKEEVKIPRIVCGCVIKNIASKKVMEKAGMKFVGIKEKEVELSDGIHDMYEYTF